MAQQDIINMISKLSGGIGAQRELMEAAPRAIENLSMAAGSKAEPAAVGGGLKALAALFRGEQELRVCPGLLRVIPA